jgi:dihydroorotate dehydrogenase (NAD+) catalytic subunit
MKPDLSCAIGAVNCKNPLLAASGTFGFGQEWQQHSDLSKLGGLVTKGLSLRPRFGNPPPRVCETSGGMLNSIGLEGPGLEVFLREKLPFLRQLAAASCLIVVNIYGESQEEFVALARALEQEEGIGALEMNLSCPNVDKGGMIFGADPKMTQSLVAAVREVCRLPLWVKLSPNVSDIVAVAEAARLGGADAICLINTLLGLAIDARTRRFKLGNVTGGLSGPAIKPVALRMVYQAARAIDLPIIGIGGISSAEDVAEFFLAGACAVQVGTANFSDPAAIANILRDLHGFCLEQGIDSLRSLRGAAIK